MLTVSDQPFSVDSGCFFSDSSSSSSSQFSYKSNMQAKYVTSLLVIFLNLGIFSANSIQCMISEKKLLFYLNIVVIFVFSFPFIWLFDANFLRLEIFVVFKVQNKQKQNKTETKLRI